MSQVNPDPTAPKPPSSENASSPPPAAAPPEQPKPTGSEVVKKGKIKKPKRPHRWRRRLVITAIVLVILGIAFRVALDYLLPSVLHKVAGNYNLDCTYERLELRMLDGDFGIWHLTLSPRNGGPPLLKSDYCRGLLSTLALLRGNLDIWRVEADGVEMNIERDAQGRIELLEQLLPKPTTGPTAHSQGNRPVRQIAGKPATTQPIDLSPPNLVVDALRLDHIDTHIIDKAVSPPLETRVMTNLRLNDFGSKVRPTRFELTISAEGILDSLLVKGERRGNSNAIDADLAIEVKGLHLQPLDGYLEPLGIRPIADQLAMRMHGSLQAAPSTQPSHGDALNGTLTLSNIGVAADGVDAATLHKLTVDFPELSAASARVGKVAIDGVQFSAARRETGNIRFAGVELVAPAQTVKTAAALPATQPTRTVAIARRGPTTSPAADALAESVATTQPAFGLSLNELAISNVHVDVTDYQMQPTASFTLQLDELLCRGLALDSPTPLPLLLQANFEVPGLARLVHIDGSVNPLSPIKTLDVALAMQGLRPEKLRPYIQALGLRCDLQDATFQCHLKSAISLGKNIDASAELTDLKLSDRMLSAEPLLTLDGVNIDGLSLDTADNSISVRSVEIRGPTLGARRDVDGSISGVGMRTWHGARGTSTAAQHVPGAAPADTHTIRPPEPAVAPIPAQRVGDQAIILPRLKVDHLLWKSVRLNLDDELADPPTHVSLPDAGLEITDFLIDLQAKNAAAKPGRIRAWFAAPNVARKFTVDGTLLPGAGTLAVDAQVSAEGLSGALIAPYLRPMGIEPILRDASLSMHANAKIAQSDSGGVSASLALDHLMYADGTQQLASIASLNVDQLTLANNELSLGEVTVDHPRIAAERQADGLLVIAGVKLLQATAPQKPGPAAGQRADSAADADLAPVFDVPATPVGASAAAPVVLLKKLHVTSASVDWTDRAVSPAVQTNASVSVDLDHLTLNRDADAAGLSLSASSPGAMDELIMVGRLKTAPDVQGAVLDISSAGLRIGALAPYLPPGLAVSLHDGQLKTKIDATISRNPKGGSQVKLAVDGLSYRDGKTGPELFAFDTARINAPRIDPAGGIVTVDEVSVQGIETRGEIGAGGVLRLLGIILQPQEAPPATAPAPGKAGAPAVAAPPSAAPAQSHITADAPPADNAAASAASPEVAARLAAAHKKQPLYTLGKLDLTVRRAVLFDKSRTGVAPISITGLHLRNLAPIDVLGPEPATCPPVKVELLGKIDPLVDAFKLSLTATPFAEQSTAHVDFAAQGIHGDGVTAIFPEYKSQIDGSTMHDGRFNATLDVTLTADHRGQALPDLSTGFAMDATLSNVEFRAAPDGPVLAGLAGLAVENARVRPQTGSVIVKSVEINKPLGSALRDAQGLHLLGMTIKLPQVAKTDTGEPPATTQASAEATTAPSSPPAELAVETPATAPTTRQVASSVPAPSTKPAAEVRVDRLTVDGLDLRFEDRVLQPPVIIPLTGLDVDVRGLSNFLPYEDRALKFSVLVDSGKVRLPKKAQSAGVPGALGDIASAMGGKAATTQPEYEDRELFSQLAATGRVSLYPKLNGWAKASINGVELTGLKGAAMGFGNVTVGGGTFDCAVDARFPGDDSVAIHARPSFTDLRLSEPAHGLVARNLALPAPLDVIIGLLEDAEGSIALPINVQITNGRDIQGIGGSALGAVSSVIVSAAAAAPLKVANVGLGLIGLGGKKAAGQEEPIILNFAPGYAGLESAEQAKLDALLVRMRKDPTLKATLYHQLGGGDMTIVGQRANLTPDQARTLVEQLHRRKLELLRLQSQIAGEARERLASFSQAEAAPVIDRLRGIDRELAQTEGALDNVLDQLKPGAALQASRRTRTAALALGAQRLQQVGIAMQSPDISDIASRVSLTHAQLNPSEDDSGGKITIALVHVKKEK